MIRRFSPLVLACLMASGLPLSVTACSSKGDQPKKTLCRQLHERNRKCVDALVTALHRRMDKVPADVQKKLAKPLALEITKSAFVGKCRELTTAKDARAKATRLALQKCHAQTDCAAYAACFLRVMAKSETPRKSK